MAQRDAYVGEPLLLNLRLSSEIAGLFPQVTITDATGTVAAGPIDMGDEGGGLYQATWTPTTVGQYEAGYLTFSDAAHTTRTIDKATSDDVVVSDRAADLSAITGGVWEELASAHTVDGTMGALQVVSGGHAGANAVLDGGAGSPNIPHNTNNNLTTCRLRIFATAVDASSATLGAADGADGEIMRATFDATNYVPGSLSAVPELLANFLRTVST